MTNAENKIMLASELKISFFCSPTHPRIGASRLEMPLCPGPGVPHRCGRDCSGVFNGARDMTLAAVLIPRATVGRLVGLGGHAIRALQRVTGCQIRVRPADKGDAAAIEINALCAQRGPAVDLQTRCAKVVSQVVLEGRGAKSILKAAPACPFSGQVVRVGSAGSALRAVVPSATSMAVAMTDRFPPIGVAASCGSEVAVSSCKNGAAVVPKRAVSAGVDVAPSKSKQKTNRLTKFTRSIEQIEFCLV